MQTNGPFRAGLDTTNVPAPGGPLTVSRPVARRLATGRGRAPRLFNASPKPHGFQTAMFSNVTVTVSGLLLAAQGCVPKQVVNVTVPVPWHGKRSEVGIGVATS
jgi:hypothetical protein